MRQGDEDEEEEVRPDFWVSLGETNGLPLKVENIQRAKISPKHAKSELQIKLHTLRKNPKRSVEESQQGRQCL